MLRPSSPLDLPGILVLQMRATANQAWGRHAVMRFPSGAGPVSALLGGWNLRKGRRQTWVASRRGLAAGVMAIAPRKGPTCWEVTWLQAARGGEGLWAELLEIAGHAAAVQGGQRLMLRLADGCPADEAARQAGLLPYMTESLYLRARASAPQSPEAPISSGSLVAGLPDEYHLFRLYQRAVPVCAKEAEGLTQAQWRDALQVSITGRSRASVMLQREGTTVGCAQVSRCSGRRVLDLLVDPRSPEDASALVGAALDRCGKQADVLCLAPGYLPGLPRVLEARGFQKVESFVSYARHVAARVEERGMVPVGA